MNSETTLVAFIAAAIGGSALYAAIKGESWSSVVTSNIDPRKFTATSLPAVTVDETGFATGDNTAGETLASSPSSVQGDARHMKAVDFAYSKLGDSYVYGSSGPNHYDCSGLTMQAMAAAGYQMAHNAELQLQQTRKYKIQKTTSPPPGTLVFFGVGGFASHCGLSIGGGQMIEAPHTGDVVKIYSIEQETKYLPLIAVTDPLSHKGA